MKGSLHPLDWAVILAYVVTLVGLGFYHTRRRPAPAEEFVLAGRRVTLPAFVMTLVATWYGGILGVGENTFLYGVQTWFIFGVPYYLFAILFAASLAPRIRAAQQLSIPDHFRKHYGSTPGLVSALFILFLSSPAPYLLSLGLLLQYTTGIPFGWALFNATILSLIYIWFGGLRAVIRTDILQFILMFAGFIVLLSAAFLKLPSPLTTLTQLPPQHLTLTGGHSYQYIFVWFFIALWTFVDPSFYQRCAAARSPAVARRGIFIAVVLWFLFDMLTLSTGLLARALIPESEALFAYPNLARQLLPPLVYGLFLTGLLATIMSTVDSFGLISAITFGRDILWRIQDPTKTTFGEPPTKYIQKGLVVMAFVAVLMALSIPSVVRLWYTLGSLLIPGLLLPFLFTFTKQSMKESQATLFLVLPVMVALGWFLMGKIQEGYPLGVEPFYPGLLTSLLLSLQILKQ